MVARPTPLGAPPVPCLDSTVRFASISLQSIPHKQERAGTISTTGDQLEWSGMTAPATSSSGRGQAQMGRVRAAGDKSESRSHTGRRISAGIGQRETGTSSNLDIGNGANGREDRSTAAEGRSGTGQGRWRARPGQKTSRICALVG
jgi:hypothetical protein